jgi:hypothetical protein
MRIKGNVDAFGKAELNVSDYWLVGLDLMFFTIVLAAAAAATLDRFGVIDLDGSFRSTLTGTHALLILVAALLVPFPVGLVFGKATPWERRKRQHYQRRIDSGWHSDPLYGCR